MSKDSNLKKSNNKKFTDVFRSQVKALSKIQKLSFAVFILLFAALGTYTLLFSHASPAPTPSTSSSSPACPDALNFHNLVGTEITTGTPACLGSVALGLGYTGSAYGANFWGQATVAQAPLNPNSATYVKTINNYLCNWTKAAPCTPKNNVPPVSVNGYLQTSAAQPVYVVDANQAGLQPCSFDTQSSTQPPHLTMPICGKDVQSNYIYNWDPNSGGNRNQAQSQQLFCTVVNNNLVCPPVPLPAAAAPAVNSDATTILFQPTADNNKGATWELWKLQKDSNGNWKIGGGGRLDNVSDSNGVFTPPLGTSAIGISMFGVVSRVEELTGGPNQQGQIDHPMTLELPKDAVLNPCTTVQYNSNTCPTIPANTPGATRAYSWPATRNDGVSTDVVNAIPEGLRFRIDPNLDLSKINLTPVARAIAVAGQKYGFIVENTTPNDVEIKIGNPDPYVAAGLQNPYDKLFSVNGFTCDTEHKACGGPSPYVMENFPWASLQALVYNCGQTSTCGSGGGGGGSNLSVSLSAPSIGATLSNTTTVSANATDNVAITSVQFKLDGSNLGPAVSASPYNYSWNTTTTTNGAHTLTAVAVDSKGTIVTSSSVTVTVTNQVTPPPTTVQNFTWKDTAKTLNWSAYPGADAYVISTTGGGQTTYTNPPVTDTTYSPPALPNATAQYSILPEAKVLGIDLPIPGAKWSAAVTVKWPPIKDTTPPTAPQSLTALAVSSSQINLNWNASTDNVGVTGYKIYLKGTTPPIAVVNASHTSFGDTGLSPVTSYTFTVVAFDAAGNASSQSSPATATTQALPHTVTLKGVVTNSRNGHPLSFVHAYTGKYGTADGAASTYTNAEGQYLLSGITASPNSHYYTFQHDDFRQVNFSASFKAGTNLKDVALPPK